MVFKPSRATITCSFRGHSIPFIFLCAPTWPIYAISTSAHSDKYPARRTSRGPTSSHGLHCLETPECYTGAYFGTGDRPQTGRSHNYWFRDEPPMGCPCAGEEWI